MKARTRKISWQLMATLIIGLAWVLAAASATIEQQHDRAPLVSIVALLANPDTFNGQRVAVISWGIIEFETAALYLFQVDPNYSNSSNGIWLDLSDAPSVDHPLSGYLYVEGQFFSGDQARGYSGRISSITRILQLEPVVN
jgi:hypothetical protein